MFLSSTEVVRRCSVLSFFCHRDRFASLIYRKAQFSDDAYRLDHYAGPGGMGNGKQRHNRNRGGTSSMPRIEKRITEGHKAM